MSVHDHFTYFESDYYLFMHGIFSAKAARKPEKAVPRGDCFQCLKENGVIVIPCEFYFLRFTDMYISMLSLCCLRKCTVLRDSSLFCESRVSNSPYYNIDNTCKDYFFFMHDQKFKQIPAI